MHSHKLPRLLLVGFMFALIAAGTVQYRAAAKDTAGPSYTISYEDVLVQACGGFDITTSYTVDRDIHVLDYYYGHTVNERRQVSFSGAIGNSATGKSFAYDGHYTRTANFDQGTKTFTDLLLRFEVGTPGEFSLSLARADFDLVDNPPAVVQAIVPSVLQMDLCYLLGGSTASTYQGPTNISISEPLLNLAPVQPANEPYDTSSIPPEYRERVSNSSESDTCTIRPRMGLPYGC
jgi:hypothetical protein